MRVKSLKALGNGAWKLHATTPVKPLNPILNRPKVDNSLIQKLLWNEVNLRWPQLAEAELIVLNVSIHKLLICKGFAQYNS